jgi:DNA-directed RNA polymerase subunit RPC12/RpoP
MKQSPKLGKLIGVCSKCGEKIYTDLGSDTQIDTLFDRCKKCHGRLIEILYPSTYGQA